MTPAEELRAAAEKVRTLAAATIGSGESWRYAEGLPSDSVRTATGWEVAFGEHPGSLRYIAAMHPGVGVALADWLDAYAEHLAASTHPGWQEATAGLQLAVARAINGQPQPIPDADLRELQQVADDEASLISPSERRAQTIGEISVTVELHCRAAGFPDLADELAGVLQQLAVDGSHP